MRKIWLNFILHLTSYIYRKKNEIVPAGLIKSVYLAFLIILLEISLFIISLPTYFLFASSGLDHVEGYDAEIHRYRLQRKVTLVVVLSVVGIFLLKVILLFLITILSGVPTVS